MSPCPYALLLLNPVTGGVRLVKLSLDAVGQEESPLMGFDEERKLRP